MRGLDGRVAAVTGRLGALLIGEAEHDVGFAASLLRICRELARYGTGGKGGEECAACWICGVECGHVKRLLSCSVLVLDTLTDMVGDG